MDSPPLTENLRFGAGYVSPDPRTYFDYSEYGGMGGAVEMCSGLGACRKNPGRHHVPVLHGDQRRSRRHARPRQRAAPGHERALSEAGLDDNGVYDALDLCLECRACKAECPVGVDMARFKSEFLAGYWETYGTPLHAKMLGNVRTIAELGSPFAALMNLGLGIEAGPAC